MPRGRGARERTVRARQRPVSSVAAGKLDSGGRRPPAGVASMTQRRDAGSGMLSAMSESHYLAGLALAGRRVVVVGGGTVAQRRLPRLVSSGALVEVISPAAT